MIREVLLVLPVYLVLFLIWYRFRYLIKIMADVEDILNEVIDTSKEGIEEHKNEKN